MSKKTTRTPGVKSGATAAPAIRGSVKDGAQPEQFKCKFTLRQIDDESDPENFIVEGYASIFEGLDSYDDRIQKGAYLETIAAHPDGFAAFVMHDTWGEMPIGLWNELAEDDKGLLVKCLLPKSDTEVAGRLVPQIKVGSVNALSIGYWAREFRFIEEGDVQIRILEKIELREISFIAINYQADPGAVLTGLKRADGQTEEQVMFNGMIDVYRKNASAKVTSEIIEYYHSKGKSDPFSTESVISTEELKNLSKSNRAYAIRELKLSTNASNYLAGLVPTPTSKQTNPDGSDTSETPEGDGSSKSAVDSLNELFTPETTEN